MKKILNTIGYLSILLIPYILAYFILSLYKPVKVISFMLLVLLVFVQILHFKRTKIKYIGIRILVTILSCIIVIIGMKSIYGIIKNIEAKSLQKEIKKIEYNNNVLENNDLREIRLEFVNDAFILTKGEEQAKIYYINGNVEDIKVLLSGITPIFVINGQKYYIRNILSREMKIKKIEN